MKLSLKLEEKQILSQQMRLSMQVLQMTSPELEQYLSELSLENPLLEVRPSRYRSEAGELACFRSRARERKRGELACFRSRARERDPEDDEPASPGDYLAPVHRRETLAGSLREQSAALSAPEEVLRALDYLIDELDERGYLPQDALPEGRPVRPASPRWSCCSPWNPPGWARAASASAWPSSCAAQGWRTPCPTRYARDIWTASPAASSTTS